MRWTLPLWLLIPLLMSCAHAKQSPITPDAAPAVVDPTILPFAAADLIIDADTVNVQVEQRTVAAAGEALTIDLSTFMRSENALRIEGIRRIDAETLGLTIGIRHPIPMPPVGQEPKFHATDVLGVFVLEDTHAVTFYDAPIDAYDERLVPGWVAADGYTRMLHPSFTDGFPTTNTWHPYVLLSEDTRTPNYNPASERGWVDVRNPIGFNVLPQGSDWRSTEAVLQLPPGQHRMRLAIQGNIQEIPLFDIAGVPQPARYCYPEGSLLAPWKIEMEVWNAGLIGGSDSPGTCEVDVKVYDWQHSTQVASEWSPITTKGQVREASTVDQVTLLIPDLRNNPVDSTDVYSGIGQPGSPRLTTFTFNNVNRAPGGFYWALAIARDTRVNKRIFNHDLTEYIPSPTLTPFRTAQVVAIPVASSATPDFITRLSAAPSDQVFLEVDTPKTLQVRAIWASGASTSIDKAEFVNELPPTDQAELVGDWTIRRLTPRDSSSSVSMRTVPRYPGLRVRATTKLFLGDPYADEIDQTFLGCGSNTSGLASVLGGPRGAGAGAGNSDHVVSLGYGGSLTLKMADGGILDKPGPDFIAFENAFEIGQDPNQIFTETVKVEVSADGGTWFAFPMDYRPDGPLPWRNPANFTGMAGITPVLANVDENSIDPTDPSVAGGDAFDLAVVGLEWANYIRLSATGIDATSPCFVGCPETVRLTDADGDLIDDEGKHGTCSSSVGGPDIDAVAIVKGHQGFPEQ